MPDLLWVTKTQFSQLVPINGCLHNLASINHKEYVFLGMFERICVIKIILTLKSETKNVHYRNSFNSKIILHLYNILAILTSFDTLLLNSSMLSSSQSPLTLASQRGEGAFITNLCERTTLIIIKKKFVPFHTGVPISSACLFLGRPNWKAIQA